MHRRYTITLPTTVDSLHPRIVAAAHGRCEAAILTKFGGFSTTTVAGAWKDSFGSTMRDDSVRYECLTDDVRASWWFESIAAELADDLNQDCVLLTCEHVEQFAFVPGTRKSW